jgi:hypothetical protein
MVRLNSKQNALNIITEYEESKAEYDSAKSKFDKIFNEMIVTNQVLFSRQFEKLKNFKSLHRILNVIANFKSESELDQLYELIKTNLGCELNDGDLMNEINDKNISLDNPIRCEEENSNSSSENGDENDNTQKIGRKKRRAEVNNSKIQEDNCGSYKNSNNINNEELKHPNLINNNYFMLLNKKRENSL